MSKSLGSSAFRVGQVERLADSLEAFMVSGGNQYDMCGGANGLQTIAEITPEKKLVSRSRSLHVDGCSLSGCCTAVFEIGGTRPEDETGLSGIFDRPRRYGENP